MLGYSLMNTRLSQAQCDWLTTQLKSSPSKSEVLIGDGSFRTFSRLWSEKSTYILIQDPTWQQTRDYRIHRDFLANHKIPVPTFIGESPELGLLLMEDLGSTLLQALLHSPTQKKNVFLLDLIEILAALHSSTFPVPAQIPAHARSFDIEKLSGELFFTETHLITGFLGLPSWGSVEKTAVRTLAQRVAQIRPLCFCHRDFHSRNVMVTPTGLKLIDFQDARMGPAQYDLASLLFDPYVPLSTTERLSMKTTYETKVKPTPLGKQISWNTFDSDLQWCGFQRMLKTAGSFASFKTRFGKDSHLKYIKPALETALSFQECSQSASNLGVTRWLKKLG